MEDLNHKCGDTAAVWWHTYLTLLSTMTGAYFLVSKVLENMRPVDMVSGQGSASGTWKLHRVIYIHLYICMPICMHIYIYIYRYVCIYTHIMYMCQHVYT